VQDRRIELRYQTRRRKWAGLDRSVACTLSILLLVAGILGCSAPTVDNGGAVATDDSPRFSNGQQETSSSEGLAVLDALIVDDRPRPGHPYDRSDWSHWDDIDGDRCDAREQALVAQSLTAAQVDPFGCKVIAGDWLSIYDGMETDQPAELDVDHVVALHEAHTSGGWRWNADRRRLFANDQDNLLAVSSSSNRSKSSHGPDDWRPPRREAWCQTATIIVTVKVKWGLTATSAERDALGQMLETCSSEGPDAIEAPVGPARRVAD
jgi:hypothetical protein